MKSKMNIKSIIILSIISIISMFFINMSFAANTAKIGVETANLREKASENSKILELISLDQEVEIIQKEGDWYKVRFNKIEGYLRQDLLKDIPETQTSEEKVNQSINTDIQNTTVADNVTSNDSIENSNGESNSNANEEAKENSTGLQEQNTNSENEEKSQESNNNKTEEFELGEYQITDDTKLKIVPAINATNIIEVKKDEKVNATEVINGWVCVEKQNTKGWIRQEKLQKQDAENQANEEEQQPQEDTNTQAEENTANQQQPVEEPKKLKTLYVNSATVNMRAEPSKNASIVTTLPVNTSVDVYEESNGWSKVKTQGKEGYISTALLSETKQETSRNTSQARQEENVAQTTTNSNPPASTNGTSVVQYAQTYIGSKYVYGGSSPSGFDCSGFTSYVYKQYGVTLNRTAAGQYSNGVGVSKENLQAGDLVMFGTSGINHVGIYIGGGMMVHAANPSRGVTTDTINSGYYAKEYVGARRVN